MTSVGPLLAIGSNPAFLVVWAGLGLLMLSITFVLMLRATYAEWRAGELW